MHKKNTTTRADLLQTFASVEARFAAAKLDIAQKEADLVSALDNLKKRLKAASKKALSTNLNSENPLNQCLTEYVGALNQSVLDWGKGIKGYARGTEFRSKCGDSFLVFGYGKVKSGKSSLGNYIAWGQSDPTPQLVRDMQPPYPNFDVHAQSGVAGGDGNNEAATSQIFKVGVLETTSSIQSFSLPGLTWVDSPGIHSMHDDINGTLARDYVKSADLVVFAMHSSSPGRDSDLEVIRGLVDDGKHLLVLLTGSDETEEDQHENGDIVDIFVMTSQEDRQTQIEYVEKELELINHTSRIVSKVLPISVKFAEKSCDDLDKLEDSGLPVFFDTLSEIARGDGIRMKLEAPIVNLRAFGKQLQSSQDVLCGRLNELAKMIKSEKGQLQQAETFAIADVKRAISAEISLAMAKYPGDSVKISTHLNKRLVEIATQRVQEELTAIFTRMDDAVEKFMDISAVKDLPGFEQKFKDYSISNKGKGRALGGGAGGVAGAAAAVAIFNWWNPAGWFAMAYAAVTGVVAATGITAVGSEIGESMAGVEKYRERVGDNLEDVEKAAHAIYSTASEKIVAQAFRGHLYPMFQVLETFVADSQTALGAFQTTVHKEIMQ